MDIDIDTPSNFDPTVYFDNIRIASMINKGELKKHPAGCYFQTMPIDPVTGLSAIPYKEAEENNFFKIDLLHLSLLDNFESKDEVRELMRMEPDWSLLQDRDTYEVHQLFQLKNYYALISRIAPTSIPELADCIALIRPGKQAFKDEYINASQSARTAMRPLLYTKPENGGYYFKKSHATAYAFSCVLHLHLIKIDSL